MKTNNLIFALIAGVVMLSACTSTEGEKADVGEAKEVKEAQADALVYAVDSEKSKVHWVGTKPTGQHHGTVGVSDGTLKVKDGVVESGVFTINMTAIVVDDIEDAENNAKLTGHLKSADFFNVEQFPTAKFEITALTKYEGEAIEGVQPTHSVSGNLTMLDITKGVTFPVSIQVSDSETVVTSPQFIINRTDWKITYKSNSVFDDLKDNFINDEIGLKIELSAKK